jgi:hypothetical protein
LAAIVIRLQLPVSSPLSDQQIQSNPIAVTFTGKQMTNQIAAQTLPKLPTPTPAAASSFVATPGEGLPPHSSCSPPPPLSKRSSALPVVARASPREASAAMMPFFLGGFAEQGTAGAITRQYKGVVFSGGTANANEDGDLADDMVTNVPAVLRAAYGVVAMSTTPRTCRHGPRAQARWPGGR